MSKNQKASGITNIINYDNSGNISFVSGSTTLMSVSSSGAVVLTGTMSGGTADSASYAYTASSATNAFNSISASYAYTASSAISAYTASSAVSASYVLNAVSASYAYTASSAINAFSASKSISSSYSDTASFANSFNVAGNLTASNAVLSGTLTAQTLVVQTITSSIDFVTGSTRFGSLLTNTHTFTGSIYQTGSIAAFAGSVGIGTTNPAYTLDVYGTGRFTGAINAVGVFSNGDSTVAASNQFQVSGVTNTNKQLLIGYNTTGNGFGSIQAIFQGTAYTPISLNPLGGNVGIGITNPAYKLHVVGGSFIGRQNNYGSYDSADADLIISNYNSDNTSILLYNQAGAYHSGLVNYYNNILSLGLNNSNSTNSILTSTAINITSTGVGIGINSPNALTEIRINTNDYGNNLMLANSYPASGVATSISFSHNTQAADPDIIARISGYIDDRTSSNRYGSLRFYTATGGTLYQRLTIASTGVPTFTVSGADTRLANFSTTTYNSARGLRINSYQSSNGGQDCAIEFDSGVVGYGGFKLSNSGTPMLTLTATGAATFSSSIGAASAGISSTSITTTPSTTLSTSRGIMVDAATTTNSAFIPIGFSWASSISTYDPTWGMALKTVNYNAGTADLVFYTGGTVRMTIGNGGGTTFTNSVSSTGRITGTNISQISATGTGSPQSLGLSINAGSGGRAYLLSASAQWDASLSTSGDLYLIRCGYNNDLFSATFIAGTHNMASFTQSGGILYVTYPLNYAYHIQVLNNQS